MCKTGRCGVIAATPLIELETTTQPPQPPVPYSPAYMDVVLLCLEIHPAISIFHAGKGPKSKYDRYHIIVLYY